MVGARATWLPSNYSTCGLSRSADPVSAQIGGDQVQDGARRPGGGRQIGGFFNVIFGLELMPCLCGKVVEYPLSVG